VAILSNVFDMNRLILLINRTKEIYCLDGLLPVIRKVLAYLRDNSLYYATYYLYEHHIVEMDEADFLPKIDHFSFRILQNIEAFNELRQQRIDLKPHTANIRQWLDSGAVVFCIFKQTELINVGWVALTQKTKEMLEPFQHHVDFSNNEACTGGSWTKPRYRGNGLMGYSLFKRFQFLKAQGRFISRRVVNTRKIASQRAHAKRNSRRYAKAYYAKLLFWKFWREEPF